MKYCSGRANEFLGSHVPGGILSSSCQELGIMAALLPRDDSDAGENTTWTAENQAFLVLEEKEEVRDRTIGRLTKPLGPLRPSKTRQFPPN